ncbi:hypothetical protein SteCoe_19916 [Stentor coeruleus]|uniref:Uncharacterized protein n=1 Tax=Stentor coeruleus TaxID=5963 RepID=A0A1R2BSZ1_9CILI|nr:hypothetical protein SteCoe_19916 [Stentor coeruleus]
MNTSNELSKQLRELLKEIFIENCNIEESSMTKEESDTIEDIDDSEILENLKDIITNLLSFKRDFKNADSAELIKKTNQFEMMLQKLEAEVRRHISVQHQLKLHIETSQTHTEDLENENCKHLNEIKDLQDKVKSFAKVKNDKKNIKILTEKVNKLEEDLKKKDFLIKKLENEVAELRAATQSAHFESEKLLFNKIRGKREEDYEDIKHKFEEKSIGLQKIQKIIQEKSIKNNRERNKIIRKSANESDMIRNKIFEIKLSSKIINKTHIRSTSEQVRAKSVSRRPPSH